MIDVHRVVARLVETVQDADAAAALGGCGEDCEGKGLLVDYLRAAVCEHETAWGDLRDCCGIETLVCAEGVLERASVLCECRRVYDHEVVLAFGRILEIIDCISAEAGVL